MTSMIISYGAPLLLRGAKRREWTIFLFFLATVDYLSWLLTCSNYLEIRKTCDVIYNGGHFDMLEWFH